MARRKVDMDFLGVLSSCLEQYVKGKIKPVEVLKLVEHSLPKEDKMNWNPKNEFEGYQKSLLEGKTNAMYYFFTQLSKPFPNYEETLKQLTIPVAVIWGKADKILRWEPQKERVTELLKIEDHNIHIIEGSHFIQEEQPDKITAIITDFINE